MSGAHVSCNAFEWISITGTAEYAGQTNALLWGSGFMDVAPQHTGANCSLYHFKMKPLAAAYTHSTAQCDRSKRNEQYRDRLCINGKIYVFYQMRMTHSSRQCLPHFCESWFCIIRKIEMRMQKTKQNGVDHGDANEWEVTWADIKWGINNANACINWWWSRVSTTGI